MNFLYYKSFFFIYKILLNKCAFIYNCQLSRLFRNIILKMDVKFHGFISINNVNVFDIKLGIMIIK